MWIQQLLSDPRYWHWHCIPIWNLTAICKLHIFCKLCCHTSSFLCFCLSPYNIVSLQGHWWLFLYRESSLLNGGSYAYFEDRHLPIAWIAHINTMPTISISIVTSDKWLEYSNTVNMSRCTVIRTFKVFFLKKLLWGPGRSNIRDFCYNWPWSTIFWGPYVFVPPRPPLYV